MKLKYILIGFILLSNIAFASSEKQCFDNAHILTDFIEGCEQYLKVLQENFQIDGVIVSIEELPQGKTIEETALQIFKDYNIGKEFNSNGILLLFSKKEKQARLEVSYSLEDVFTDIFCGFAQDRQLRHYFLSDDIEFGLMAVMEEIEKRAALKMTGNYTPESIKDLDLKYFAGGAGAARDLGTIKKETIQNRPDDYPAGKTPEQAFSILIRSWKNKVRNPDLGVYTEIGKIVYSAYTNQPDSVYEKNVTDFDKPFEVIQNPKFAVVHFGKNKGWENSPFLFANTNEGWKFDIVNQLKHIRMGRNPLWGVEVGNYFYTDILKKFPTFGENTQDIPLPYQDIYRIQDDIFIANQIRHYQLKIKKENTQAIFFKKLGRFYAITANRKAVKTLKQAIQLDPEDFQSHKYLSIVLYGGHLQKKSALKHINIYRNHFSNDPFGYSFEGYLNYKLGNYSDAETLLLKSLELDNSKSFAYCYLARVYAMKYKSFFAIDPRKESYRKKIFKMKTMAQNCQYPHKYRIAALNKFLKKQKIKK